MDRELSVELMTILTQWGDAIANKQHDWLEEFFTDDFLGTAQPWPTLTVDKTKMIELDKSIEKMDTEWLKVTAHRYGNKASSIALVQYNEEKFAEGSVIGENMPKGDEIAALTAGRVAVYSHGWIHNGERWQVFDHHLITVIEKEDVG